MLPLSKASHACTCCSGARRMPRPSGSLEAYPPALGWPADRRDCDSPSLRSAQLSEILTKRISSGLCPRHVSLSTGKGRWRCYMG